MTLKAKLIQKMDGKTHQWQSEMKTKRAQWAQEDAVWNLRQKRRGRDFLQKPKSEQRTIKRREKVFIGASIVVALELLGIAVLVSLIVIKLAA